MEDFVGGFTVGWVEETRVVLQVSCILYFLGDPTGMFKTYVLVRWHGSINVIPRGRNPILWDVSLKKESMGVSFVLFSHDWTITIVNSLYKEET